MAELIRSIGPGKFPAARDDRSAAKKRAGKKSDFSAWLGGAMPGNMNDAPVAPPMLSLEDEIMLARMRERARLFTSPRSAQRILPPQNSYAYEVYERGQNAPEAGAEDERQYAFTFMLPFPVELDEEV